MPASIPDIERIDLVHIDASKRECNVRDVMKCSREALLSRGRLALGRWEENPV